MKAKRLQLGELWRGNTLFQLIHLKGERSRFLLMKQDMLGDGRMHRVAIERTFSAIMLHWDALLPDRNDDIDQQPELVT